MDDAKDGPATGREILAFSLRTTLPVLAGYMAIGFAFGLLLESGGYPWWLALVMSVFVYAGAAQFMAVGLFAAGTPLGEIALLTLLMNARHAAYGLSLLGEYGKAGKAMPYLVFALTDETYALVTGTAIPERLPRARVYAWMSALDQSYWVTGSVLGALAGAYLPIPTEGIGFALVALFIVLALEKMHGAGGKLPFAIAGAAAMLSLALFGRGGMLIPAIGISAAAMSIAKMAKPGKERP